MLAMRCCATRVAALMSIAHLAYVGRARRLETSLGSYVGNPLQPEPAIPPAAAPLQRAPGNNLLHDLLARPPLGSELLHDLWPDLLQHPAASDQWQSPVSDTNAAALDKAGTALTDTQPALDAILLRLARQRPQHFADAAKPSVDAARKRADDRAAKAAAAAAWTAVFVTAGEWESVAKDEADALAAIVDPLMQYQLLLHLTKQRPELFTDADATHKIAMAGAKAGANRKIVMLRNEARQDARQDAMASARTEVADPPASATDKESSVDRPDLAPIVDVWTDALTAINNALVAKEGQDPQALAAAKTTKATADAMAAMVDVWTALEDAQAIVTANESRPVAKRVDGGWVESESKHALAAMADAQALLDAAKESLDKARKAEEETVGKASKTDPEAVDKQETGGRRSEKREDLTAGRPSDLADFIANAA